MTYHIAVCKEEMKKDVLDKLTINTKLQKTPESVAGYNLHLLSQPAYNISNNKRNSVIMWRRVWEWNNAMQ